MKIILVILFSLAYTPSNGQLFAGKSLKKDDQTGLCELQINKDSTAVFICHDLYNYYYLEFAGNIQRVNDTLYEISTTKLFTVLGCDNHKRGRIIFHADNNFTETGKVTLIYKDGYRSSLDFSKDSSATNPISQIRKYVLPGVTHYSRFAILDPKHFHRTDKPGNGEYTTVKATPVDLDLGHKNPISGKPVLFRTLDGGIELYRDMHTFNDSIELLAVIKGNKIKVLSDNMPVNTGPFLLAKK